jgi:hypothetical protein
MSGYDALLPELWNIVRGMLSLRERFLLKRTCKQWAEEEKEVTLGPGYDIHRDNTCSQFTDQWRGRQRLLLEWTEAGGFKWDPRDVYISKGNDTIYISAYWYASCPFGTEGVHIMQLTGNLPVISVSEEKYASLPRSDRWVGTLYIPVGPRPLFETFDNAYWEFAFNTACDRCYMWALPIRHCTRKSTLREAIAGATPAWFNGSDKSWSDPTAVITKQLLESQLSA